MIVAGLNLQSDFLKVGHHGSQYATTSQFLDAVQPKYAVISCSLPNQYGFPTNETLQRLLNHNITTYATYNSGTIIADTDGARITLLNNPVPIISPGPTPLIHDVAITGINPYRTIVCNRTLTSINVTVANQGDIQETFTLVASYNSTAFASQMITVGNGTSVKWLVIWNTSGISIGNYNVTASVDQIPGENDTSDNSLSCMVKVSILGDINSDGRVDMKDVSYVARRFMCLPNDPLWDCNADINEDAKIDMKDVSTIAKEFGNTT
jgi:hypothetical protein